MRIAAWVVIGLSGWLGAWPAQAADGPVIVIPGKAGVPVVINGGDASFCVVEGEFGLDRPGQVAPTIVACPLYAPTVGYSAGYFPAFGRRPGYGRHEIEPPPNRRLPRPAEPYYREWGIQSMPLPASIDPPANVEINVELPANSEQQQSNEGRRQANGGPRGNRRQR